MSHDDVIFTDIVEVHGFRFLASLAFITCACKDQTRSQEIFQILSVKDETPWLRKLSSVHFQPFSSAS